MAGEQEIAGTLEKDVSLSGILDKAESLNATADGSDTLIGDRCKKLDFRVNCSLALAAGF